MNKKFKNFLKKPLLIISSVLLVIGLAVVITYACLPFAHTKYTYKTTEDNKKMTQTYQFKKGELYMQSFVDGEKSDEEHFKVTVKDGKLYIGEYSKLNPAVAEINAFSIKVLGSDDMELINHGAKAIDGIAIAFLVLGVAGLATSITFMLLDGKKKKTKKA